MAPRTFPSWFPADCPPAMAVDANGSVFRIVTGPELREEDFRSHHELGRIVPGNPCGACGVSVFDSFLRAQHRLSLTPRLGNAIAEGLLDASAGMMQLTNAKSGHMETEKVVTYYGRIGEIDVDNLSFTLRDTGDGQDRRGVFGEEDLDNVLQYLSDAIRVAVAGVERQSRLYVVAIAPADESSDGSGVSRHNS